MDQEKKILPQYHHSMYVYVVIDHYSKGEVIYRHRTIVRAECANTDSDADIISRASTKAMLELNFYGNPEYVVNTDLTSILGNVTEIKFID